MLVCPESKYVVISECLGATLLYIKENSRIHLHMRITRDVHKKNGLLKLDRAF